MAQKPQLRVQMSPRIIKVAVFFDQHSPRLGQRALSQTVCSLALRTICSTSRTVCGLGTRLVSQTGKVRFKNNLTFLKCFCPQFTAIMSQRQGGEESQ